MNENQLANIIDQLTNAKDPYVRLFFSTKSRSGYISYAPNVDEDTMKRLIELIIRNLESKASLTPVQFNPMRYCADSEIETCSIDYVGNFQEVLDSFSLASTVDTNINPSELTFYCLEVVDEEQQFRCHFFRRVTKFKKLSANGITASFSGNTLKIIEEQMFGLDGFIDLVCFDNSIYVLNHIALERVFRLEEQFSSRAAEALRILGETRRIRNFEQFENDCIADSRYHKALSRMLDINSNIGSAFDNFNNIREVIDVFQLNIEIQEGDQPQLIYDDKSQRMDIIRIINDAYCRSIICAREVIHDI